jgi:hypothetical protein
MVAGQMGGWSGRSPADTAQCPTCKTRRALTFNRCPVLPQYQTSVRALIRPLRADFVAEVGDDRSWLAQTT